LERAYRVLEYCYAKGWTDGLPVVPPARALVDAFVEWVGRDPDEVVISQEHLGTACTVRLAAANAVMAGCRKEYFPVVLAALEALHSLTGSRGLLQSTTGQAVLVVVNGPIRRTLGLNAGVNVLGPGRRANATIGRAVRLVILNALGIRPGELDQSTQGTPAKYTCCIAENEEESPWEPLHVGIGMDFGDSAVSVSLIRGTLPVEQRESQDPETILQNIADSMSYGGAYFQLSQMQAFLPRRGGHGAVVILGPEHAGLIASGGWGKEAVRWFLFERFGRRVRELRQLGKGAGFEGEADATFARFATQADAIHVVVAGGRNAGVSCVCPTWTPMVTRRVPG
jgi:hypothetical protein